MIISKHSHSCLLVKDQGKVVLLDPGIYTVQEHALNIDALDQLDAIGITHEHPDHFDIIIIKSLIMKFPHVSIFSTDSVKTILEKEHIHVRTEGNEYLSLTPFAHEKIWMGQPVQNVLITLFNKLAHPGDCLTFDTKTKILALPIAAPWGSTMWAVEKALGLQPKLIIPIHDFMLKDEVRIGTYNRLEDFFGQQGIKFLKPQNEEEFIV